MRAAKLDDHVGRESPRHEIQLQILNPPHVDRAIDDLAELDEVTPQPGQFIPDREKRLQKFDHLGISVHAGLRISNDRGRALRSAGAP